MQNILVGRYQRMGEIGRGGFGMVEEFLDLITGNKVAIKTIPPYFVQHESKRMIREVDIMRFLHNSHPHVIDFIAMFVTRCHGGVTSQISNPTAYGPNLDVTGPYYEGLTMEEKAIMHHDYLTQEILTIRKDEAFSLHIVLPLMKGDLFYFINLLSSGTGQRKHRLTQAFLNQVAAVFAFQLIFGLDWVHKCGIVHRDLKPDNVLVRLNTDNAFYSSLCIADFGLARNVQSSDTFYVCTRNYRPPEIITSAILSQPSMDIWSLGCILYEMCTGETLFKMPTALDKHGAWNGLMASSQLEIILSIVGTPSKEDIMHYMPEGNAKTYLLRSLTREARLEKFMDEAWTLPTLPEETILWRDLIKSCLAFFPQQRPSAEQLSHHPLFVRYQMIVGHNINQIETRQYRPSITESNLNSKMSQISALLEIIHDTLVQTRPTLEEEEESVEESSVQGEQSNAGKSPDDMRLDVYLSSVQTSRADSIQNHEEVTNTTYLKTKVEPQSHNRFQPLELCEVNSHRVDLNSITHGSPRLDCVNANSDVEGFVMKETSGTRRRLDSTLQSRAVREYNNLNSRYDSEKNSESEEDNNRSTRDIHDIIGKKAFKSQSDSKDMKYKSSDVDKTSLLSLYQGKLFDSAQHDEHVGLGAKTTPPRTSAFLTHKNEPTIPYDDPTGYERLSCSSLQEQEPYNGCENNYSDQKFDFNATEGANQGVLKRLPYSDKTSPSEHEDRSRYSASLSYPKMSDKKKAVSHPCLNLSRTRCIPFPKITDPLLYARYGNLNHTEDTLQAAIESILNELNDNRRDVAISLELRALLSYFCLLRGSQ